MTYGTFELIRSKWTKLQIQTPYMFLFFFLSHFVVNWDSRSAEMSNTMTISVFNRFLINKSWIFMVDRMFSDSRKKHFFISFTHIQPFSELLFLMTGWRFWKKKMQTPWDVLDRTAASFGSFQSESRDKLRMLPQALNWDKLILADSYPEIFPLQGSSWFELGVKVWGQQFICSPSSSAPSSTPRCLN